MNEKPIIFSGEMVRAILDGRKTMTRRTGGLDRFNKQPARWRPEGDTMAFDGGFDYAYLPACPYGRTDGLLWVRESFSYITKAENEHFDKRRQEDNCPVEMLYKADAEKEGWAREVTWKPSIHMPRWASRLTLRVTAVRVERVQDITEEDARAEGVGFWDNTVNGKTYRGELSLLWNRINEKRGYSWESNPFVWVVEFEPVD